MISCPPVSKLYREKECESIMSRKTPRIGLALGGGGARGLCHIKFCKALDEMEIKPSIISGTSIGSIVGSLYAAGISGTQMEAITERLSLVEITRMLDFNILQPSGLVKGNAVMDFLDEQLPVKYFEALDIPLKIIATDFWNRQEVVFESGPLIPAIRASISVPVVFQPVKVNDRVLIDGGAVNPLPYDTIRSECDILIAIDVSGTMGPRRGHSIPTMFEVVMNSLQIMETTLVEIKMKSNKPDIYIKPELKNIQLMDFHRDQEIMDSVKQDVHLFKRAMESILNKWKFTGDQWRPKMNPWRLLSRRKYFN